MQRIGKTVDEKFLIDLGEKQGKILADNETVKDTLAEIKDYLLENGLVQQTAVNEESIKRIWVYLTGLFFLLLVATGLR